MAVERKVKLDDGGYIEYHDDGRVLTKNKDNRITDTYLPASVASSIGAMKGKNLEASKELVARAILEDMGVAWVDASQHNKTRALLAAEEKSYSVTAIRDLARDLVHKPAEKSRKPKVGEVCFTCGHINAGSHWNDIVIMIYEMIQKNKGKDKQSSENVDPERYQELSSGQIFDRKTRQVKSPDKSTHLTSGSEDTP